MRKLGALSPVRLVYQSIDSINALISMQIVEHGFSKTLLNFKPSLSQLPRELQTLLLKSAEKSLDQVYTVRTLLLIWMACVENGNIKEILTPRYLYNDEDGRKFILSKLGQFGQLSTDKVDKLSFFMYSFYNHGKAGSKGFEFTLKDDQLQDPRLMLRPLEQDLLAQVMSKFTNVETLVLPTVANSELLEVISMTLSHLKILDISCSTNVTDYCVMSLAGNMSVVKMSLEQIFLEGTGISSDGLVMLLTNVAKLEVVESSLVERALDVIDENQRLNLRKVTVGRFWRGDNVLKKLVHLCPRLCQLVLPNLSNDQCALLAKFSHLPELAHIHVGQVKFESLLPALVTLGQKLKTFTYSNFTETVDVMRITRTCPNLESLALNCGCLMASTSSLEVPKKLQDIRLNVHAFIAKNVWTRLLQDCLDLAYLDMTPGEGLNDQALSEIMRDSFEAMLKLRSFIVRGRHTGGDVSLTEKTVENLIMRSPGLKCIGDCSTWSICPNSFSEFLQFSA